MNLRAAVFFGIFLSALVLVLPNNVFAQRTRLAAALIDEQVLLTSSFSGTKVTIFGAVETATNQQPDMIVLVRGPDRSAWVSQKLPIMGLWVGQRRAYFAAAPTFFGVASTRPIDDIAAADTQKLYGLTAHSQVNLSQKSIDSPHADELTNAFIQVREKQKLYVNDPKGIKIQSNGLFRADIKLPDLTPPGLYTVKVYVFKNGRQMDTTLSTFVVTKVGLERAIYKFATDHKITHSIFGVGMALFAGFLSARVFRRLRDA